MAKVKIDVDDVHENSLDIRYYAVKNSVICIVHYIIVI